MHISCEQNEGQCQNIKMGNKSFEMVANLKYLGMMPENRNCMHEKVSEIKSGACPLPFDPESFVFIFAV